MIQHKDEFDRLLAEAQALQFSGWDWSWDRGRWQSEPLPWDYPATVRARFPGVQRLLDMETGGGELLASLMPLPPHTVATEDYPPNVPIARERLEPLGVTVAVPEQAGRLPFADDHFDLVINRHGYFQAGEVFRVLRPGGTFITQQVGGRDNIRLNELLQDPAGFQFQDHLLAQAVEELGEAGFEIVRQEEAFPKNRVYDVGAVVIYLRIVQWQIEDFNVERYRDRLAALHNHIVDHGHLSLQSHRFLVEARKPT